jgi:predicted DNA-binding helix-hairpin-helix protein
VGATPETDRQILTLADSLYQTARLKRVYYSAYVPVNRLPASAVTAPPLLREHRLYQADWLMRVYGFGFHELLDGAGASLETEYDPKVSWALRHLDKFPVEVNTAPYEQLLRVPGIGMRGASKITRLRQVKRLRFEDLQKLAVVLKRARYFITVGGKYEGGIALRSDAIREKLSPKPKVRDAQLGLFDAPAPDPSEAFSSVTGEL